MCQCNLSIQTSISSESVSGLIALHFNFIFFYIRTKQWENTRIYHHRILKGKNNNWFMRCEYCELVVSNGKRQWCSHYTLCLHSIFFSFLFLINFFSFYLILFNNIAGTMVLLHTEIKLEIFTHNRIWIIVSLP